LERSDDVLPKKRRKHAKARGGIISFWIPKIFSWRERDDDDEEEEEEERRGCFFVSLFYPTFFSLFFFSSSCILLLSSLFWITSLSDPISPRISSEKKKTLSALCAGRERACARNPFSRRRERFFWTDDEKKTPTWNAF
jgi:hypothetical protein